MKFGSVCSGIEAASAAWNPLGWRAAFLSEIDPFASAVLAHHHPTVPNLGDMTKFKDWPDASIDVLCGGTPCQSFSNAGLRDGLDDPRGQLMLTFGAIAARYRPRWLVWENVPGVLSSNGGRDFGAFLGLLGHLGYGFAYRVLDAQFVRVDGYGRAVPQRRQRVFVVGCLGDWRSAAAVLLERASLRGDPAPRRSSGARVAATLTRGAESSGRGGYAGRRQEDDVNIVAGALAGTGPGAGWRLGADEAAANHCVAHTLRADGFDASEDGTGRGTPLTVSYCLNAKGGGGRLDGESETLIPTNGGAFVDAVPVGVDYTNGLIQGDISGTLEAAQSKGNRGQGVIQPMAFGWQNAAAQGMPVDIIAPTLDKSKHPATATATAVRRLMPVECERLQGFPDGHTAIMWRGKPAADGPRYRALGNSWAVNCARWLGRRLEAVESIKPHNAKVSGGGAFPPSA
jgi:DNA (cytosine-5)-methyltransferase 1